MGFWVLLKKVGYFIQFCFKLTFLFILNNSEWFRPFLLLIAHLYTLFFLNFSCHNSFLIDKNAQIFKRNFVTKFIDSVIEYINNNQVRLAHRCEVCRLDYGDNILLLLDSISKDSTSQEISKHTLWILSFVCLGTLCYEKM